MTATITLVGRVVGDPETRAAGSSSVTKVRIPVDSGFGDRKSTTWWNAEIWGKRGQTLQEHVPNGSIIFVSGEPCVREYDKNDGTKGYSCDVKNASWSFVPRPSEQSQQQPQQEKWTGTNPNLPPKPQDSDIPF